MAPIFGKILNELVIDQETTLLISAFDPARFREYSYENSSDVLQRNASWQLLVILAFGCPWQ